MMGPSFESLVVGFLNTGNIALQCLGLVNVRSISNVKNGISKAEFF